MIDKAFVGLVGSFVTFVVVRAFLYTVTPNEALLVTRWSPSLTFKNC